MLEVSRFKKWDFQNPRVMIHHLSSTQAIRPELSWFRPNWLWLLADGSEENTSRILKIHKLFEIRLLQILDINQVSQKNVDL